MKRDWGGLWRSSGSETADGDISVVDGVKEGGVGRGAKGAGDISGERSIF